MELNQDLFQQGLKVQMDQIQFSQLLHQLVVVLVEEVVLHLVVTEITEVLEVELEVVIVQQVQVIRHL